MSETAPSGPADPDRPRLVLASASPRRLRCSSRSASSPSAAARRHRRDAAQRSAARTARRLARDQAHVAEEAARRRDDLRGAYIVAADTVVAVGRRILPKAELPTRRPIACELLSGRSHRVYSGVCLITPGQAAPADGRDARPLQAPVARGDRKLPRLGRMARQGRRLCHPGPRGGLRGQARRLLQRRGGPAALRNREPARRRRLSGARRPGGRRREARPRREEGAPLPRSAAARRCPRPKPFCSPRCADIDLGRWLGERYVIAGPPDENAPPPPSEDDDDRFPKARLLAGSSKNPRSGRKTRLDRIGGLSLYPRSGSPAAQRGRPMPR